ncbi:MAG TPA: hypothetical protein VFG30_02365 [Polyangiales bacterium]|nr:hypothetical protein [Polyangiales bacterium]
MDRANSKPERPTSSRAAGWWRVGIYCTLLALFGIALTARGLAAEASERSLLFGQQLGSFQMFAGRSTDLVLNGQQLSLHTQVVKRPVREVLNDFAQTCRAGSERAASEFIEHTGGGSLEVAALQRLFVMRDQRGDQEGTALCFAGLGEGGLSDVTARFSRFAETFDLSELGGLRYVYLKKVEHGTHVIFVTGNGSLSLHGLWPSDDRDVAGAEAIAGVRPKDSVRFISAHLLSAPRGLTAYRSTRPAAESLRDYAQQVRAGGYEVLDFAALGGGEKSLGLEAGVDLRVLRKDGQMLIATSMPDGTGSYLSVVQL